MRLRYLVLTLLCLWPLHARAGYVLTADIQPLLQELVDSGILKQSIPRGFDIDDVLIQKTRIIMKFKPDCTLDLERNPGHHPPWFIEKLRCSDISITRESRQGLLFLGLLLDTSFYRTPWKFVSTTKHVYEPWTSDFVPLWFSLFDAATGLFILLMALGVVLYGVSLKKSPE